MGVGTASPPGTGISIRTSSDLVEWNDAGTVFKKLPDWHRDVVATHQGHVLEGGTSTIRGSLDHADPSAVKAAMVVPIISYGGEKIRWINDRKLEIEKQGGTIVIEADTPLRVLEIPRERILHGAGLRGDPIGCRLYNRHAAIR